MKPKLILCLALILSGDLLGCSTAEWHNSTGPDSIDAFVAALSADFGLWINGTDASRVTEAQTPQEVVSETFRAAKFEAGLVTSYRILEIRNVHISGFQTEYTAVLADTNLGQMIVLMQYIPGNESTPGQWWRRIYDASPKIKRLY